MKLPHWVRALTPLGRTVSIAALVLIALAAWWIVASWQDGRTAKVEARLNRNQAEAALASGADAVATIGRQGGRETAIDAITRENDYAIRSAPGADAPVSAELDALARERLCRRTVYRQRPECLQHAPAP